MVVAIVVVVDSDVVVADVSAGSACVTVDVGVVAVLCVVAEGDVVGVVTVVGVVDVVLVVGVVTVVGVVGVVGVVVAVDVVGVVGVVGVVVVVVVVVGVVGVVVVVGGPHGHGSCAQSAAFWPGKQK